ncbi:MAG: histidinol dehydrogenase [Alphaproteobacteria bacterium]|nr:histidinol dehydrogenase [Alphaproteobacteria bacterium]
MAKRLNSNEPGFEAAFENLLTEKREVSEEVDGIVAGIIADVRVRGDAALIDLSKKFDSVDLASAGIAIGADEIAEAKTRIEKDNPEALEALKFAHDRIMAHHLRQKPESNRYKDSAGVELGERWTPVESAGLYVPGGTASYPSSVLMNGIPAKVAGVNRIVMVVPTPGGEVNPLVLVAGSMVADETYRVGGAQAIAALAYGTKSIAPVATIVGPGNAFVAAAKRQVYGTVGIDSIAGPSEVLVIADSANDPDWIAADLLAQAEHDTAAQSILMTDDAAFADRVEQAVDRQLAQLPRSKIAGPSWRDYGTIIVLSSLDDAPPYADRIAAEHLEIATANAEGMVDKISNAGAIFIGCYTPEVIGDYVAGTNHVLPTARSSRFSSGLGVLDFMKRTSLLKLDAAALSQVGPAAMTLARCEGLEGHRRSVELRLNKTG